MNTLLLAPHYDDEILFASYAIMQSLPDIAWAFAPFDYHEQEERRIESEMALEQLLGDGHGLTLGWLGGCEGEEMHSLTEQLVGLAAPTSPLAEPGERPRNFLKRYDHIIAPMIEPENEHSEHNACGEAAFLAFGPEPHRITYYATYQRGRTRAATYGGSPFEPTTSMIQRKLRALACFGSQIEHPQRRPWFYDMLDMREWYA